MAKVLLLYASVEGHTARVAERMAARLREAGHEAHVSELRPGGAVPQLMAYEGIIVGASVHYGRHPSWLRRLLAMHLAELQERPCAFFSVSLSARHKPALAERYLRRFLRRARWQPQQTATFAGALRWSRYPAWKRLLMLVFVRIAGGDTDASHDYEYTDWDAVAGFTAAFARRLSADLPHSRAPSSRAGLR